MKLALSAKSCGIPYVTGFLVGVLWD